MELTSSSNSKLDSLLQLINVMKDGEVSHQIVFKAQQRLVLHKHWTLYEGSKDPVRFVRLHAYIQLTKNVQGQPFGPDSLSPPDV